MKNISGLMKQAQQMQERIGLRNQPLNEISALLSGSQVTTPQFNPFSAQGIGAAPIGSYIGQNYANAANSAAQQNAGLFGLGGSLLVNALIMPKQGATNAPSATQDQIYSVGAQGNTAKLGQPLPLLNLVSAVNRGAPHPAQ